MSDTFSQRFGGTQRLYGKRLTEHLRQCHVVVTGIGGVGSWVVEALARTAIGEITLIDLDDICISNTNRQVHALNSTIGQPKISAMAQRVRDINPDCVVHEVAAFIGQSNVQQLIPAQSSYVIDAIDNVRDKAATLNYCRRNKIPVLTIGAAGGQIDPTQVAVADLNRTTQDPLAKKLRSVLQRHYGFSKKDKFGIDCVYSTEHLRYPQPDGEVCAQKPQGSAPVRLDCATGFGATTCVTATFAFVAVARVLAKIEQRWQREQRSAALEMKP